MRYHADGRPIGGRIGSRTFALETGFWVSDQARPNWRLFVQGPFRVARFPWRNTPGARTLPPHQTLRTSCTAALACTRMPADKHRARRFPAATAKP